MLGSVIELAFNSGVPQCQVDTVGPYELPHQGFKVLKPKLAGGRVAPPESLAPIISSAERKRHKRNFLFIKTFLDGRICSEEFDCCCERAVPTHDHHDLATGVVIHLHLCGKVFKALVALLFLQHIVEVHLANCTLLALLNVDFAGVAGREVAQEAGSEPIARAGVRKRIHVVLLERQFFCRLVQIGD